MQSRFVRDAQLGVQNWQRQLSDLTTAIQRAQTPEERASIFELRRQLHENPPYDRMTINRYASTFAPTVGRVIAPSSQPTPLAEQYEHAPDGSYRLTQPTQSNNTALTGLRAASQRGRR